MTTPDDVRKAKGWHKISMWISDEDEKFIERLVEISEGLTSKAGIIRDALHAYAKALVPYDGLERLSSMEKKPPKRKR